MLQAINLTKKFGDFTAVANISFKVEKGEFAAFLGPNGAGKTTSIKMFTTLLHPTAGSIELNGIDPTKDRFGARRSFGIVFQDPSVDDELTAYENMKFHAVLYGVPAKEQAGKIEELLTFVELWERKDGLVKTFSGGMKRRLEIARALLHEPAVLFLDEPTVGLDPQTRNHMWSYIEKLNREKQMTVLFTTHYMEEAEKFARRVLVIDHGKMITDGSPAKLMQDTAAQSLEEAFLKLTGHGIREEAANAADSLRQHRRMWGGRR
ncbi:MAG: ATP-binding cassette domain-containing protein [Candidatus Magasanikbacteria bacterium]|nr:ATP-binding cassette domain-containing protein [Candidatus Magasanikbacteria bacterium]